MIVYIYDNTFEGLLTCIHEAYYSSIKPEAIYSKKVYAHNLIDTAINVETDTNKSVKVYEAIKSKISKSSLKKVYHVYLSELKESSNLIFSYVRMGVKLGQEIELHKHNDIVLNIDKISKNIYLERHRFTGFVRFKQVDNILYSSIEPDSNIVGLLGNHFKNRLLNEYFIINDSKRNIALVYYKSNYYLTTLDKDLLKYLNESEDSGKYKDLWKDYFKSINIEERENPKLQKRNMPYRYWKT